MKIHHMGLLAMVAVGSWVASMATTACSSSSSPGSSGGSSGGGSGGSEDGSVADTGSSSGATDSGSGSGSGGGSGGSSGDSGACIPQNGTYTLTVTAFGGNVPACPATSDVGIPATLVCPGDAGRCVPLASDMVCSCAGTTLTCTSMLAADGGAMIHETLNLDFAQADFSGSVTLSSGGVPCSYTITSSM